jgi:hypothetical protein
MKTKTNKPSVEDINSINSRHKFVECGAAKIALNSNGHLFVASNYDSLIRKIRENEIALDTGCSVAAVEDQRRLDFLNVMLASFESGFSHGSPFIASAVGGAFTNVRDAIDSLMSDTKRIEAVVLPALEDEKKNS